ncbi:hypothetical protein ACRRTK_022477 [Alexandromys fortis]
MSGFLLTGFSDNHELQILHALLFLVTYLLGSAGNFTIITITTLDPQLQSPMYYFLKHLSFLDLSSLSVTVPQSIANSLAGSGYISYTQCMLQVFFFAAFAWGEMAILTVMSYDRYVAICFPLHYEVIMCPRNCSCAYLNPTSDSPTALDLLLSIFYTVLPPALNPVIYSLRNESIKTGVRKLLLSSEATG